VQAGSDLLAWSEWAVRTPCGSGCISTSFGTDLFTYNQHTRVWRLVAPTGGAQHDAAHAVWTGRVVLVQSSGWCGGCLGPSQLSSAAQYDPATNRWTPLPPGPLASAQPTYSWTGGALFSFNPGTTGGGSLTLTPGDASAYDAATGWVRLPSAPFGCGVSSLPIWTGRQVLMYCPRTATVPASNHDGIALTAGP
jgi:hypothetical protein